MDELDQLLLTLPADRREAVRLWAQEQAAAGMDAPTYLSAIRAKYSPTVQADTPMAARDVTAVQPPTEPSNALGALGLGAGLIGGGAGLVYGGTKGVQALGGAAARRMARGQYQRALAEAPESVEQMIQRVRDFQATGRNRLTLSDVSPRLSAEADFVATNDPATRTMLSDLHTERTRQRPTRMIQDAQRIAPGGYADPGGLGASIEAEQRAWAAGPEGYGGLRERFPRLSQGGQTAIHQFLNSPRVTRAWQDAQSVGAVGPLPTAEASSFEVMQGFKERLDGLTDAAWRKGDGDLGRRLGASRDELVRVMNQYVPGYERVTNQYRRYSEQRQALEAGQELWREKLQAPELERRLAAIPESDRWLVQRGMLGSYLNDIENARTNTGTYEAWLTELPTQERKLQVAFGGERQFKQALQTYEQELSLARLGQVGAGSQTALRQGRQAATSAAALGEAANLIAHPITGVPLVARRGVARWVPGAVAREMAPMLAPRTAPEIEALLRMMGRLPK